MHPIGERLTNLLQTRSAEAGALVIRQGGTGTHVTIGTVIVRIASEALRERVKKRDLNGAFFLTEDWWGIFIETSPEHAKDRSPVVFQGLVTRSRSLSNCRSHTSYPSCGVPRGLCSSIRAAQKGPSAHLINGGSAALQLLLQVEVDRCDLVT